MKKKLAIILLLWFLYGMAITAYIKYQEAVVLEEAGKIRWIKR